MVRVIYWPDEMMNSLKPPFSLSMWLLVFCLLISLGGVSCTRAPKVASYIPPPPEQVEPQPKPKLTKRELWRQLVRENRYAAVDKKLKTVNAFFNRFDFVEDKYLWGTDDYWASLQETLDASAGDCEDITIAKYFTLKDLDIPDEEMRLTYVISLKSKKPHIVLTFRPDPAREPLVLDTTYNYLFPVSRRRDLVPVYSFNEYGSWVARLEEGWEGEKFGSPAKIPSWWKLLQRVKVERVVYSDG